MAGAAQKMSDGHGRMTEGVKESGPRESPAVWAGGDSKLICKTGLWSQSLPAFAEGFLSYL